MSATPVDILTAKRADHARARQRVALLTEVLDRESILLDRLTTEVRVLEEIRRRRALITPPAPEVQR